LVLVAAAAVETVAVVAVAAESCASSPAARRTTSVPQSETHTCPAWSHVAQAAALSHQPRLSMPKDERCQAAAGQSVAPTPRRQRLRIAPWRPTCLTNEFQMEVAGSSRGPPSASDHPCLNGCLHRDFAILVIFLQPQRSDSIDHWV